MQCTNNLKQLILGMRNFEVAKGLLPPNIHLGGYAGTELEHELDDRDAAVLGIFGNRQSRASQRTGWRPG